MRQTVTRGEVDHTVPLPPVAQGQYIEYFGYGVILLDPICQPGGTVVLHGPSKACATPKYEFVVMIRVSRYHVVHFRPDNEYKTYTLAAVWQIVGVAAAGGHAALAPERHTVLLGWCYGHQSQAVIALWPVRAREGRVHAGDR